MDPVTAGLIGSGVSAVAGFFGGNQANKVNQREAQKNRLFASSEAMLNRNFQERMRNTEWQSAVADMTAAGVNPALAYSRGGATSPGGSMAGGTSTPAAENTVSSAMQALSTRKSMQLLDEQIKRTREETKSQRFQARQQGIKADFDTARYLYFFNGDGTVKKPLRDLLDAEVTSASANSARSVSEADLARFSVPERKALGELFTRFGEGGKGMQLLVPLLSTLMRSR